MSQCLLGKKHKYTFVKDVTLVEQRFSSRGGLSVSMKARAEFRCECGQTRTGARPANRPGLELDDLIRGQANREAVGP